MRASFPSSLFRLSKPYLARETAGEGRVCACGRPARNGASLTVCAVTALDVGVVVLLVLAERCILGGR